MMPTLKPGDTLISFNWYYLFRKPKIGDLVIVQVGGMKMVKRIRKIGKDEIYVEGDNKKRSTDSRDFGPLSMDLIVGKVVVKF